LIARFAADLVLVAHLFFILFVVLGGLLVLRRRRIARVHVPAVLWAVIAEWLGLICPLTPLENALRRTAGETGYRDGFIEHYLTAVIYPEGLTREAQFVIGGLALIVNVAIYWAILHRRC
jgi:hypothetical protein